MKTFNNDPKLKGGLLEKLRHHQELDTFIQGKWLTDEKVAGNGFKGCFYGCTMQTMQDPREKFSEHYQVDLWYCYLTENIFENLPDGEYQKFPAQSIEVLPVGFDINKIKSPFFYALLMDKEHGQINHASDNEEVRKVIEECAALFKGEWGEIDASAASAAASAARATASAARAVSAAASAESAVARAASAAARSVSAESAAARAARAARAAARAALAAASAASAAGSAASAAGSAARAALAAARAARAAVRAARAAVRAASAATSAATRAAARAASATSATVSAERSASAVSAAARATASTASTAWAGAKAANNHYIWMRDLLFKTIKDAQ